MGITVIAVQQRQNINQKAQLAPPYTYLRQSVYSADGTKNWSRDCLVDPTIGPNFNRCTAWSGPGDLTNLRGTGGGESYSAFGAFVFNKNGVPTLRQTIFNNNPIVFNGVTYNRGQASFKRDCPVDPNNGINFGACEAWSPPPGDVRSLRGVGNEAYTGYTAFTLFKNNQEYFRQSFIDAAGTTGYSRDCLMNAAGPDFSTPNSCTWNPQTSLGSALPTYNSGQFGSVSGVMYVQNGQKWFRQVFLIADGTLSYYRICGANDTVGIDFNNCPGGWQSHPQPQVPLNGGINKTFGSFEEFTYTVNRDIFSLASVTSDNRPNIVVVLADDLDTATLAKALELGLMPKVQQYIISRGTTFSNSFVTNSLCCPSRATFLTGQYTHNHGTQSNTGPNGGAPSFKDNDSSTIATWLRNSGYKTSFMGKYLNEYGQFSDVDKNGVINLEDAKYIPPGWDNWVGLLDPFVYTMSNYRINDNGVYTAPGANGSGYLTDYMADRAVTYIQVNAGPEKPFFLYVAPPVPHIEILATEQGGQLDILQNYHDLFRLSIRPPQRYLNSISATLQPKPSYNEADVSDKPAWLQAQGLMSAEDDTNARESYQNRLEALRAVDDMVGKIGAALEGTGKLANTVFVFTSDNGFQLGEHRLTNKTYPYEESIQVPLFIAAPGFPKQATEGMAVNTDLAPTFSEFAGVTPGLPVDGRSLVPLMRNVNLPWRKRFLIEHYSAAGNSDGFGEPPTYYAVRTDKSAAADPKTMYAEYITGDKEFYDLNTDPYELSSNPSLASAQVVSFVQQLKTCSGSACATLENSDPAPINKPPVGSLDAIDQLGNATGWSADPDVANISQSVTVQMYIDGPAGTGVSAGAVVANLPRGDVNQAGYPGNHGFSWPIPAQFKDGKAHTLYAYGLDKTVANVSTLLSNRPLSFTILPPIPPAPTGLKASCPTPGTTATLSWTASPGATSYSLRIDDQTNPWDQGCNVQAGDFCGNPTTTSYTYTTTPGHVYLWWVHANNAGGGSAATSGGTFFCTGVPVPTVTPTAIPPITRIPTATKTPTATPTKIPPSATPKPSSVPTGIGGVPSATPRPSNTPVPPTVKPSTIPSPTRIITAIPATPVPPTATPQPGTTLLKLTLFLHGIGKGGDNVNPTGGGTVNPLHQQRQVTVEIFDKNNTLVSTKTGLVVFTGATGSFVGQIDLGTTIATDAYTARVGTNQFLKKVVPGILSITKGQSLTVTPLYLVTGDANNDNRLNVLDYNAILDCFSNFGQPRNCADPAKKQMVDINDDGNVNEFDYNLFLRELSVQTGQ